MAKKKQNIPAYGTAEINGVTYFRTRITDADGKRVPIYASTCEELYKKEQDARQQVQDILFRKQNPTVEDYCERWLLMRSATVTQDTLRNYRREMYKYIVCYDIRELGKQLKKIGMLVVQDQVWNCVTINRAAHKSTRYYIDEMHLLLKEEQTAAYTVEIWKRFRKWGGVPTGITQNVKDLLSGREVENIFENSDFMYMLNQAGGDRQILAKQLGISTHQLSYVTHSGEGEGLLFYGSTILPFVDHFPKNTELYRIMTTKPQELKKEDE